MFLYLYDFEMDNKTTDVKIYEGILFYLFFMNKINEECYQYFVAFMLTSLSKFQLVIYSTEIIAYLYMINYHTHVLFLILYVFHNCQVHKSIQDKRSKNSPKLEERNLTLT